MDCFSRLGGAFKCLGVLFMSDGKMEREIGTLVQHQL